jgi:hypothetical protein
MDKRKAIYKLAKSNRYTLEEIAAIVDMSQEETARVFSSFSEAVPPTQIVVGQDKTIATIIGAIKAGKHVILHGEPGIGKTISAKKAVRDAGKVLKMVNLSDTRTGQMLAEWLYGSHQTPSDVVFLFDEIDNFHWQSYAYFKKVLEESKVTVIMTCNDIDKVSKAVVEHVKKTGHVIRMNPPTKEDLRNLLSQKYPERLKDLDRIYDKDFRVVMRRLLFNVFDTRPQNVVVKTQQVVGTIFGEKDFHRRFSTIKNNSEPILWLTTWLDYNAARFMPADKLPEFLDDLSRIENRMFKTSTGYMNRMFASLPCSGRRMAADFPAALFNAEKEPKKEEAVEEVKKVEAVKVPVVTNNNAFDPFSF